MDDQIKVREAGPFRVWPENTVTVRAFMELEFCWIVGKTADGSTCLVIDPAQIKNTLELLSVKRREWKNVFNDLKVMESAALEALSTSN